MRKNLITSFLYTIVTGVLLGILYPLLMAGLAHTFFPEKRMGSL